MQLHTIVLGAALATGIALLAACNTRVPVMATLPATKVDLAAQGVKRIAVGDVKSNRQDAMTASALGEELRAALVNLGRFEIMDRSAVDSLLQEHRLNSSGLVDGATTVAAGKFSGATALVISQVTKYEASQKAQTKSEFNNATGRSETWYQRNGSASIAVSFKILDVQTGKVIAITPFSRDVDLQYPRNGMWQGSPVAEFNLDAGLTELRAQAVTAFVRSIAPYQVTFTVELETDGDLPTLEEGNKSAKIGEWAEAEAQYRKAVETMQSHPGAHYNLGIALRSQGKFDAALVELKQAYKLEDSNDYLNEIEMTKRMAAGSLQQ